MKNQLLLPLALDLPLCVHRLLAMIVSVEHHVPV
jgi:hypothetical protein